MNIINSIHLILAAGGKCELYHPNRGDKGGIIGTVFRVDSQSDFVMTSQNGKEMVWDWHYVKDCKIPLNSFAHLCRAVEANPLDNPAVRALGRGYEASVINGRSICCRISATDDLVLTIYDGFIIRSEVAFRLFSPFLSLLREGYPVGIPAEHWIDREKLEESK